MIELAYRAKECFGWHWISDHYDISLTAQLHKDLEKYVGQLGFDQIPEQYDELLYDLHHCLHAIQFGKNQPERTDNFQIEWQTDDAIPLPRSFEFTEQTEFGDLILINPYVGHNPLQIFNEQDWSALDTTCRFHDIIKPGIVLTNPMKVTKQEIVSKFKKEASEFVERHGEEKIRYYAGAAVVGRAVDPSVLQQVKQSKNRLILDRVEFHD
jgi:hypothetical protein